jgi:hypothetical protein
VAVGHEDELVELCTCTQGNQCKLIITNDVKNEQKRGTQLSDLRIKRTPF